jgi:hypothetical protein
MSLSTRKPYRFKGTSPLPCRICGKPVTVETCKTDEGGKAVHEECYVLKLKLEQASKDGHPNRQRHWKRESPTDSF